MYNPAGMAGAIRDTGIWGTSIPSSVGEPVFDPIDYSTPIFGVPTIRIAPNDSVPMRTEGPVPGSNQSWWDNFKESVENGAVWFANQTAQLVTGDPVIETPAPPPTPADTNNATMLLVAGAVAILLIKGRG